MTIRLSQDQDSVAPFDPSMSPTAQAPVAGPLTTATMQAIRADYARTANQPNEQQLAALEAVAMTMEAMANDSCPAAVYLASLDPGIGKTQTAKHFARALVNSASHRAVGMVICLGRLSQVEAIAREIDLPAGSMAVLTSDDDLNAMSTASVEKAQVLLTTQQGIERRADSGPFDAMTAFRFRGAPRAVRVWDEALEMAAPISLRWSAIASLADVAMRHDPDFAEAIHAFAESVRIRETGDAVEFPDFEAAYGISWRQIESTLATGNADQLPAAQALRALNGTTARVVRENDRGAVVVSFAQRVPEDLKPILVLDASIRVRQTYKDMEIHRGEVVRLPTAIKDYQDLTIHLWQTSGSKNAFAERGVEIVNALVNEIMTKPNEIWLVVTHKSGSKVRNIGAAILSGLPAAVRQNVSFLTFGAHMATNDYVDAANVIIAGQLFAPQSHYVALTHASRGREVSSGLVAMEEAEATKRGELCDVMLQAVARGRCRRSIGAKAAPMHAYVIASVRSGIPELIPTVFPNCSIVPWRPVSKVLKGNLKRAVDYVEDALRDGRNEIPYSEIRTKLDIDRGNFSRLVTTTTDWHDAIAALGCEIKTGPSRALIVTRKAPE